MTDYRLPFERGFRYGINDIFRKLRFIFSMFAGQLVGLFILVLVRVSPLPYELQMQLMFAISVLIIAVILSWKAKNLNG